jgi:hypothetical protein
MLKVHFKSDYRGDTLLKSSVTIMRDCLERKGAAAYKIPNSVQCSYKDNLILMVIKQAEGTNNAQRHGKYIYI